MWTDLKKQIRDLVELHFMLTTREGWLWIYNTRDPEEWQLYLWTKRN